MKKLFLILNLLALFSAPLFAQEDDNVDDIFGGGTDEFEFERFSDDRILLAIDADAAVNCTKEGLCTLSAVTSNSHRFTVNFNLGEGNMGGGYGGYGNGGTGSGTVINIGDGQDADAPRDYWGVNIRYTAGTCTQKIKVPRALFYSINRYMYGLMNSDGSVRRGFTPADEAMILFYTTILNKASGCSGGGE
ncbi:MAG: hypothetical protein EP326_07675 [Deltaproteobacteria bacterium]|nr:MAG: hypothetical protein EP326_07675 [Deltaproteobacteria bacterium]